MRSIFRGYYPPTAEELSHLWSQGLVIVDTSSLTSLYRLSNKTRGEYLRALSAVSDRLWIPHQVGLEYQRNRISVVRQQFDAYASLEKHVEALKRNLIGEFQKYSRHPFIDAAQLVRPAVDALDGLVTQLLTFAAIHSDATPDRPLSDAIWVELTRLLEGRVGQPYDEERLGAIVREGERRYQSALPPGFKDAERKSGTEKYGDWILWRQILDKCKHDSSPALLVLDDLKEDWWNRHGNHTSGPHPFLIQEFMETTGQLIHFYRTDTFIREASRRLDLHIGDEAVHEVRELANSPTPTDDEVRDASGLLTAALHGHDGRTVRALRISMSTIAGELRTALDADDEASINRLADSLNRTLHRYSELVLRAMPSNMPDSERVALIPPEVGETLASLGRRRRRGDEAERADQA